MKRNIFLAALCALCAACSNNVKEPAQNRFANFTSGQLESAKASGDTIGIVCGRFFSSERIDTLYCVAIGTSHYCNPDSLPEITADDNLIDNYVLTNDEKHFAPLYLFSFYYPKHIKVNDLDKDGKDEIGLMRCWWIGTWFSYEIFDFYEDEWNSLCRSITFYDAPNRDWETMEIARASEKEGFIIAQEDGWTDGCEEIVTRDVEIAIERTPIEYKGDTLFTIPDGKQIILPLAKASKK